MRQFANRLNAIFIAVVLLFALSGCMPPSNPDTYGRYDAGMGARVQHGKIVDIRPVKLQGSEWGAPIGAVAGGVGGSFIGGNTRMNVLGALGGAAAGAVAGHYASEKLTSSDGLQYIIRLDTGKTVAVVQGKEPSLSQGQRVLVLFDKKKTRVVADDTGYRPPAKKRRAKPKSNPKPVASTTVPTTTSSTKQTVTTVTTTTTTTTNN